MSIFGEILSQTVSISDFQNPRLWMLNSLTSRTASGENVSPERALSVSAYFHCIRSISEDLGKMPLFTYKKLKPRGKERAPDHPVFPVLTQRPNFNMTAMAFKESMTANALGYGNGYAEIEFSRATGDVKALWPIHPTRVQIKRQPRRGRRRTRQRLGYTVHNDDGTRVDIPQRRMLHLHGLGGDAIQGWSVFQVAAQSLGLALAQETFSSAFFGNGTHIAGAVKHPGALSDDAYRHLRESWAAMYQGPVNAHKFGIFEEGMEWIPLGVNPNDAQLIESKHFSVEEIGRWFRMHPQKMGIVGAKGSGQKMSDEDVQALYITDTLMPWMERWQQELNRKLFFDPDQQEFFAKFLVLAALWGSPISLADTNSKYFHIGVKSQNEIREEVDENPVEGGDTLYIPVNMVPDHLAREGGGGRPSNADGGRQSERDQTETDQERREQQRRERQGAPDQSAMIGAFRPVLVSAFETLLRKERNAITRAVRKHEGDKDNFIVWLDGFMEEQRQYALDLIEAPRSTLTGLLRNNGEHDAREVPRTLEGAAIESRSLALQLHSEARFGMVTKSWGGLNKGREELLADALLSEFTEHCHG